MVRRFVALFLFVLPVIGCGTRLKESVLSKKEPIYLLLEDLTTQYLEFPNCPIDTTVMLDSVYLKLHIEDCRGKLSFVQSDKRANTILTGQYINGLDTLKKYSISRSASTGKEKRTVFKYFEPIPSGQWLFYKENGKVDTTFYEDGFKVAH